MTRGRVTAIQYSRLATSFWSLAILLPIHLPLLLLTSILPLYSYNYHTYASEAKHGSTFPCRRELMWVSTEHQWFLVVHIWQYKSCIVTFFQPEYIGRRASKNGKWHAHCPILRMSVNGTSMIFGLPSSKLQWAALRHWVLIKLSAAFLCKNGCNNIAPMG